MKDVHILMLSQMPPVVVEGLSAAFTLHRAWEQPDRDAFIREVASDIRGLAPGVHYHVGGPLFDMLPNLEIVSSMGVGYDTIDAREAGRRGIIVTNTPDVLTDEVADLALGLLVATVRQIPQADRYLRAGGWLEKPYPLTATLRGRKVGILGLGRIGKAIATRLEAFGLDIAYHGRSRQDVPYRYEPTLLGLAEWCDVLLCVAPGGKETDGIIDAGVLKALGPDGVLINVGRGSVVDERALVEALQAKTILSAGLDVFADEPHVPESLRGRDNVVLLPHVGSATVETRAAMTELVLANVAAFLAEGRLLTPVP